MIELLNSIIYNQTELIRLNSNNKELIKENHKIIKVYDLYDRMEINLRENFDIDYLSIISSL